MAVIESKNVDLIVNKDSIVDLYDEQIIENKYKSANNEKILNQLVGRMSTVENYTNNFSNRIDNIENNTISQTELNKIKKDITTLQTQYSVTINKINDVNLDGLKADVKSNRDNLSALNDRTTTINNKVNVNTEDIANIKTNLSTVVNKTNTIEQVVNTANNTVTRLEETTNNEIKNIKKRVDGVSSSLIEITQQITEIKNANNSSTSYDSRIRNIELNNNTLNKKVDKFDERITTNKNSIDSLTTRFNNIGSIPAYENNVNKYLRSDGKWSVVNTDTYSKNEVYNRSEVDTKINSKADKSHGNHVPNLLNDVNKYLRSDNTWQTITLKDTYGKSEIYNKSEIDDRVNAKVSKSGDTMTGTLHFSHNNSHIIGKINDSDYYRITGINTDSNSGYLEIAVADDGSEGIVLRQYGNNGGYNYGDFTKQLREVWLMDGDGDAVFPQKVLGDTFYANDWFRAKGNSGFYFQAHGGGWFMQDSDWIRSYGNKNIYTAVKMRADGGFEGTATFATKIKGNKLIFENGTELWIE